MSALPLKYKPRPQQQSALEFFQKCIKNKTKFILLDAPTGSGKSYLPTLLGDWYLKNINKNTKFDVITQTKSLQRQYVDDFNHMANLYGKSNYHCSKHNSTCDEGKNLNRSEKHCSENCPYMAAFNNFCSSTVRISNYHLFNSYKIYIQQFWNQMMKSSGHNILFVDEAHLFEETFCDFISNRISHGILKRLEIDTHEIVDQFNQIRSIKDAHKVLVKDIIPAVKNRMAHYKLKIRSTSGQEKNMFSRKYSQADNFILKFNRFIECHDDGNWVMNTEYTKHKEKVFSIEPVWGKKYINEFIWDTYDHVVLMSGTILDQKTFSSLNGFTSFESDMISFEHVFPAEKRPVFYFNKGKMSKKHLDQTFERQIPLVKKILKRHKNHKGIIHTGNYAIAEKLMLSLPSEDRFIFHDSENRDDQLLKHMNSSDPTILVSPSMFTGVDLKDDLSRFQIILKIPFPYLGSSKIQLRMKQNQKWYNWKTINDLVQSYGRSIRSREDWAYTYLLDGSFEFLFNRNKHLIPKYFMDGISAGAKLSKK